MLFTTNRHTNYFYDQLDKKSWPAPRRFQWQCGEKVMKKKSLTDVAKAQEITRSMIMETFYKIHTSTWKSSD